MNPTHEMPSLAGEAPAAAEPASVPHEPRPRILIVEDELLVALDIKRRLSSFGFEVVGPAADGKAALEVVRAESPDLVLMDIGIRGETDGVEVAQALRAIADVPVIYVTGNSDEATVRRAQATHPYNYIVKPIRDRELRIGIDAALHHHQLARELRAARDDLERRVQERTAELERTNALLQGKIAEQIQLARSLRLAQALTEEASRSKSRFFRNITQEIRTPINGIMGMIDIARWQPLNPDQNEALETAYQCGNDLIAVIDEIIAFAELETGEVRLQTEPVDLRELLPSVLAPLGRQEAVEITCDIAPEVPPVVWGDRTRLGEVMRHLVAFPLRAAKPREVEVDCEVLESRPNAVQLHVTIRDNSAGFPIELQRRVQRVFTQPDPGFGELDGLGVGVAIPALLVRRMNGILWLETIPGLGNALHCVVCLPLGAEASERR